MDILEIQGRRPPSTTLLLAVPGQVGSLLCVFGALPNPVQGVSLAVLVHLTAHSGGSYHHATAAARMCWNQAWRALLLQYFEHFLLRSPLAKPGGFLCSASGFCVTFFLDSRV